MMLNCLTYIAFVYWAVVTVHTVLPVDVAVCGADVSRGGLGALFNHAFGGDLDVDVQSWHGFPCNSRLHTKIAFLFGRPGATLRHILNGGGQDELFVPILFIVPLLFCAVELSRRLLGLPIMSQSAAGTLLKGGVALGCRGVILLQALMHEQKESLYFKRYSKTEFCIIAWTAYIIEVPVFNELLVSGGTAVIVLLMCILFPHHMRPDVNPVNVATQVIAAAAVGIGHAYYQQRCRLLWHAAVLAAHPAAKAAEAEAYTESSDARNRELESADERVLLTGKLHQDTEVPALPCGAASSGNSASMERLEPVAASTAAAVSMVSPVTLSNPTVAACSCSSPGVACSVSTLQRVHGLMCGRLYISRARLCRFAIKIQHAHLSDLPPDLVSVINLEVLSDSGWMAVSAHAREGCVELVLDLRPLVPARPFYGNGGNGSGIAPDGGVAGDDRVAQPDQDCSEGAAWSNEDGGAAGGPESTASDPATLQELGRSILAYLQHCGVIHSHREESIYLQIGTETVAMTWQRETQAWVTVEEVKSDEDISSGQAGTEGIRNTIPTPPTLRSVSPRVAMWPGDDDGARLRLITLLTGPSAEEILAGGGIVVRSGAFALPYSVLRVEPQVERPAATAAATLSPPQLLMVELAVRGAPCCGLLQVEARSSGGLLSAPMAVVVDYDSAVVAGLSALVADMDDVSADGLLEDYGAWLDLGMKRVLAAAAVTAARKGEVCDSGSGGCGGGSVGERTSGFDATAYGMPYMGMLLASIAGPAVDVSYLNRRKEQAQGELGFAAAVTAAPPPPVFLAIAGDVLGVCCRGSAGGPRDDAAVAVVADRLIACVLAGYDNQDPSATFTALLEAVQKPPNAGALHMAVATGSRCVVEVLVRWYEQFHGGSRGDSSNGPSSMDNPWLIPASCGVTPLHVAAVMQDGGAMAAWLLCKYDSAGAAWDSTAAMTVDGLTPAALAAQMGGRWWLRLAWPAISTVVRSVRRALTSLMTLGHASELLWGFRDPALERRFADTGSGKISAASALYVTFSLLMPLVALVEAAMYGSFKTTVAAAAALAALLLHRRPKEPLLLNTEPTAEAFVLGGSRETPLRPLSIRSLLRSSPAGLYVWQLLVSHLHSAGSLFGALLESSISSNVGALKTGGKVAPVAAFNSRRYSSISFTLPFRHGWLRRVGVHVWHTVVKAAVAMWVLRWGCRGLGSWGPGASCGLVELLRCRGELVLEAVVRPLLEQENLKTRLWMSVVDAPATWLLYMAVEHSGLLSLRPMGRLLIYQVILLATTAAVSAANRIRFLRAEQARLMQVIGLASEGALSTRLFSQNDIDCKKGKSWSSHSGIACSAVGGGGSHAADPAESSRAGTTAASAAASEDVAKGGLRGDDQMGVGGGYRCFPAFSSWAWLRG